MIVKQQTFNFIMTRLGGSEIPVAIIFTDSTTGENTLYKVDKMATDEIAELITGSKVKVDVGLGKKDHE